ncbi:hypothetical protein M9434_005441 [Picochlorum sp. BPE23]|nr:hypothetical protein M9434_005441 [Picochlorum sp. BPE23]
MDPAKYNNQMQNIAYGEAFMAAAEDYKKEMLREKREADRFGHDAQRSIALKDLFDDPELEKLHGERLAKLQEERERRVEMERKGHGAYEEISEAELLEVSTQTDRVVAHFFHPDFDRCKIMDKHLSILAPRYFDTRFVKVSVEVAPFLVKKLNIRMLPCTICFQSGVAGERLVGFDRLGGKDDFDTSVLEGRLLESQVIRPSSTLLRTDPSDIANSIRQGFYSQMNKTQSDEDSDFE